MKRWTIVFLVMTLLATCGVGALYAQGATADQYRVAADKFYAAKDYAKAYQYYAYAAKLNPNDAAAFKGVGYCLYAYNKKADAVTYLEKSLALNPADTQLASTIQTLKAQVAAVSAATAPAQVAAAPAANALVQGKALFQQKQFAAAIPYLQQAVKDNPNDYQGYYLLGYSQYMTQDMKNAAVNFGIANTKQPNPSLKAYSDKLKASLAPADQQWVDAQIVSGGKVQVASAAVKPKKFGIRVSPGIALFKLEDFDNEGAMLEARYKEFNSTGGMETIYVNGEPQAFGSWGQYTMIGEVPEGNLFVGIEPVIRPSANFEVAFGLGIFSLGKYSIDVSSPNLNNTALTDNLKTAYDISAMPFSLSLGYTMGKGKVAPRLSAGADYYSVKIKRTASLSAGDLAYGDNGDFKSSGIGFHADLGLDFKMGSSVVVGPYLRYRVAKFDDFTGTMDGTYAEDGVITATFSEDATLMYSDVANAVVIVSDSAATTGLRNLEVDLGGVQFGVGISVFF